MSSEDESPISQEAYDQLAAEYDDITRAGVREYYEWPAVRSLLPPLDDVHILDAACGDGFYTERIIDSGATAIGVDASPEMITRARERFTGDDRVQVKEADLTSGLSFLDNEQFDLVVCQLALEHIADWESVFTAFDRVLKPGGRTVISTSHPVRDYVYAEYPVWDHILVDSASYANVERTDRDWGDEDEEFVMPFYRRPLAAVFDPPVDAGLVVERVVEPEVTESFSENSERASVLRDCPPLFLCLRFLKPR